jgi:hypothetical protein
MANGNDPIDRRLERAKTILEILAIVAAGGWAAGIFCATQYPSLEHNALPSVDLSYGRRDDSTCYAHVNVGFNNEGKGALDIDRLSLRAWSYVERTPRDSLDSLSYVDIRKIEAKKPDMLMLEDSSGYLVRHYPPGMSAKATYTFVARQRPSARLLVRTDLISNGRFSNDSVYGEAWDTFCDTPDSTTKVTVYQPAIAAARRLTKR